MGSSAQIEYSTQHFYEPMLLHGSIAIFIITNMMSHHGYQT